MWDRLSGLNVRLEGDGRKVPQCSEIRSFSRVPFVPSSLQNHELENLSYVVLPYADNPMGNFYTYI
jgi:hypothetical protein